MSGSAKLEVHWVDGTVETFTVAERSEKLFPGNWIKFTAENWIRFTDENQSIHWINTKNTRFIRMDV